MNKKLVSLFIVLVLGLVVISGCSLNKNTVGRNIPQQDPDSLIEQSPIPSEDVTYQGVLNMLNNCEIHVDSGSNINCAQTCEDEGQTCIFWYLREANTTQEGIHPCAIAIGSTGPNPPIADCVCCNP